MSRAACSRQGKFLRFAHKDMAALESRLQKLEPEAGKLIVVDGVFSMEGDIIQLPELCRIAERIRRRGDGG